MAANALIEGALRAATPDYGWLSEESADESGRLASRFVWVVDPIDGTRAYLAGREDWCVSVALVEGNEPVLGAVFAPVTREFFWAARGAGAFLNDQPIVASGGIELLPPKIAGPKPLVDGLGLPVDAAPIHPRIGSLALRLCRVAEGRLDLAFVGGRSHDWDLAAAHLIVQEAGGRMSTLGGDPIVYNRADVTHDVLVAAGRERHASVIAHFRNQSVL